MKTTLKLIIALVLAGAGIGQTWADPEPPRYIGHITYTKGTDDHGTLSFYNDIWNGKGLSTGEALDVNNYLHHPTDDEGKDLEGYCVYIYAYPDEGYTVKDMTLEAEVTTTVMQSRRRTAADSDASFDIGQKLTLTPMEGTPYIFEMVIPEDPNLSVTVTAKFAPKGKNTEAVSYIDAEGVTQTKEAGTVYVMDGTEEKLAGWYVCNSTISYIGFEGKLKAIGDVHLILADGAAMSVEVPDGNAIDLSEKSLTIYGQSTGADMGSLTVYGQHDGIGAGGNVTINGGGVDVNGNNTGIAARNVNINGGKVTAYGYDGYGINSSGDLTLGWNSASGSVKAASYHSQTGSVKIADGKVLEYTDDSETVTLRGTLDADAIAAIGWKMLTPYGYGGYCGKSSVNGGKNVTWEIPLVDGAPVSTLTISGEGDMADYDNYNASNFAPWIKPHANGNSSIGLKYESVTAVTIGDGVTSIGRKAFDRCYDLTRVSIGEDVTNIGNYAFYCCGLTSVTIPASVANIGEFAFYECSGITSVNIPASVATIGEDAFGGCGGLTTVTVNRYVSDDVFYPITNLVGDVFDGCDNIKLILVPDEAAYDAYYGSDGWDNYKAKLAPQKLTVAKNASGWGTYCHRYPVSYSVDGATAYIVIGLSEDGKSVRIDEAYVELEDNVVAAAAPATPLLLNYEGGEGSITLTAEPAKAMPVGEGDIVSTGEGCTISGNMTGSNLKHDADTDDGIPALTGVAGETSYALYNGNFLRIDTDKGIDGHRWVLTVNGDACPDVIALSGAAMPGYEGTTLGHIISSATNGTLTFYASKDVAYTDASSIQALSSVDNGISTENLTAVTVGESTVGYRVYVRATGNYGYTPVGMTPTAEVTTSAMMARQLTAADPAPLGIGQQIEVTPVDGYPGVYSFVMPNDPNLNVSITADFEAKATNPDALAYIDDSGTQQSRDAGTVYVLDGTEIFLGQSDVETWYVCTTAATANEGHGLEYNRGLMLNGTVHLILADGSKMSITNNYDGIRVYGGDGLTIYGQGGDSGLLSVTANGTVSDGIDIGKNYLTINGGTVKVRAGYNGLKATGIVINGGIVDIEAAHDGIYAEDIAINGGQVTATTTGSNRYGIYANSADHPLTLGFRKAGDFIQATSYNLRGSNTMIIKDDQIMKYGSNDTKVMGTYSRDALADLAGQKLTPYGYGGYCGADDPETDDVDESKNVTWEIPLVDGAPVSTLTISGTGAMADYENTNASNFAPWIKPDRDGNASDGLKYESVTAVNIGDGVTYIGEKAFDNCRGITSVTIGEGVTTIGNYAFMSCGSLTSVNIPASVTEIGDGAFQSCVELTTVTVNCYVPDDEDYPIITLGNNVFNGCEILKLILVPDEAAYNAYYDGSGWRDYQAMLAPQTMTLTKNASGWGTYCHRFPVIYSVDGATAYTVAGLSEDGRSVEIEEAKVIFYDIEDEVELTNHAAPATPLLLNYGSTGSVTLTANPATATDVSEIPDVVYDIGEGCAFYANTTAYDLENNDCDFINHGDYNSYMLYNGEFVRIDTNKGLAAHRCVLNVPNSNNSNARVLTIDKGDGDATAISSPKRPTPDPSLNGGEWYDLSGRRVNGQTVKKGVYINNGRKVMIK